MARRTKHALITFPARSHVQLIKEPTPRRGPRPHLLVIDPDESFLQSLRRGLGDEYDVSIARDATEGARTVSQCAVDLVVVDLGAPPGDGIRLIEEVRGKSRLQRLPLLVLCSSSLLRERVTGKDALPIGPKPRWLHALSATVNQCLQRSGDGERPSEIAPAVAVATQRKNRVPPRRVGAQPWEDA